MHSLVQERKLRPDRVHVSSGSALVQGPGLLSYPHFLLSVLEMLLRLRRRAALLVG